MYLRESDTLSVEAETGFPRRAAEERSLLRHDSRSGGAHIAISRLTHWVRALGLLLLLFLVQTGSNQKRVIQVC
jgi:hypothetical protein